MIRGTYLLARDFDAAAAFENRLAEALGDPLRRTPDELRRDFEGIQLPDSTEAPPETAPQEG